MKKIALIDDYPIILESYTEALSPLYKCVTHTDPVDALNDPSVYDADVVFIDYTMPGMNGIDAYTQLKDKLVNSKVAFLTGANSYEISKLSPNTPVLFKHDNDILNKMIRFIEGKYTFFAALLVLL